MNNLKKGFTWIIIAIILALIAGGGTYAAWRIQNSSKNEIQLPVSEVGTNTSDQQESDNWKTYRNEKYGFELRYPTEYDAPVSGWWRTAIDYNFVESKQRSMIHVVGESLGGDSCIDY